MTSLLTKQFKIYQAPTFSNKWQLVRGLRRTLLQRLEEAVCGFYCHRHRRERCQQLKHPSEGQRDILVSHHSILPKPFPRHDTERVARSAYHKTVNTWLDDTGPIWMKCTCPSLQLILQTAVLVPDGRVVGYLIRTILGLGLARAQTLIGEPQLLHRIGWRVGLTLFGSL